MSLLGNGGPYNGDPEGGPSSWQWAGGQVTRKLLQMIEEEISR